MLFHGNTNRTNFFYSFLLNCSYIPIIFLLFSSCHNTGDNIPNAEFTEVFNTANKTYDIGKHEQAIIYLDAAAKKFKSLSVIQKFNFYSFNFNYYFNEKKDNHRALAYADSAWSLFNSPEKKLRYTGYYGRSFFLKGDVLFASDKFNDAYQYYYEGKLIADKSLNACALGEYSYRMGMIMYKQEHFRLAAANFKNCSNEIASCNLSFSSFYRIQETISNTGLSYSKIGEADSAMIYFKAALDYIDRGGLKFDNHENALDVARGVIYGNEANIFIQKNSFQTAENLLKKSSEINLREGNDNRDAQLSELKLAHLYYQAGEMDSLRNLLVKVNEQLDTLKNLEAEVDYNFLMSNYSSKVNNAQAALDYFVKYDSLKDSLQNKKKALKEADISKQIKKLEIDNKFEEMRKNNQLQDFYLKVGAVFGLMLICIFLLIFLNWRKSNKNIKILGRLNHTINDQNLNLENALEGLRLSSQEKDRILRTVAHDLRNPIGGIASLTNAMAEDDYTEDQKELINLISETSHNSLELINEILEVTTNGPATLKKEHVEVNSLVSKCVELLRFKAAEKHQLILFESFDADKALFVSREKIWRVVSNLISNAIKFSPADGTIWVAIRDLDEEIEISVKDAGIGIPENLKNNIFHMFTEAKRPGTAGEKSFGLGLSISKQIIEDHGGKIWFENNAGAGATFYLRLPDPVHIDNIIPLRNQHKTAPMTL